MNDAAARGATLRLFGGLAVTAHCESVATHPKLQRVNADMDLLAPRTDWPVIEVVLSAHAFVKTSQGTDMHFQKDGVIVELSDPLLREGHAVDLTGRLKVEPLTASLADLLLFKLQRQPFASKDRTDAVALLLDHRVSDKDEDESIGVARIVQVTSRSFALWDTVYRNTIELEKTLDRYLEPEEAQLVWRRIERLQGDLDRSAKSIAWWSRAIFDRTLPWYH